MHDLGKVYNKQFNVLTLSNAMLGKVSYLRLGQTSLGYVKTEAV